MDMVDLTEWAVGWMELMVDLGLMERRPTEDLERWEGEGGSVGWTHG